MTEENQENQDQNLESKLQKIVYLLQRYKLVEGFVRLQDAPEPELIESIIQKQNLANLRQELDKLHPADIARILEMLPLEDRLIIWGVS